jgi:hypothetical protein
MVQIFKKALPVIEWLRDGDKDSYMAMKYMTHNIWSIPLLIQIRS